MSVLDRTVVKYCIFIRIYGKCSKLYGFGDCLKDFLYVCIGSNNCEILENFTHVNIIKNVKSCSWLYKSNEICVLFDHSFGSFENGEPFANNLKICSTIERK